VRNVYVPLSESTIEQLRELARREYRGAKEQAAWLILDGLRRAGLEPEQRQAEEQRTQPIGPRA
jgi:hypothetical protein